MTYRLEHKVAGVEADALFDLVLEVERYPEFVPGWEAARVRDRRPTSYRTDQLVRLPPFRQQIQSFTTFDRPNRIEVTGQGGIVRRLDLKWLFVQEEAGCRIELVATLDMAARAMQGVADAALRGLIPRLLRAFVTEAQRRGTLATADWPVLIPGGEVAAYASL